MYQLEYFKPTSREWSLMATTKTKQEIRDLLNRCQAKEEPARELAYRMVTICNGHRVAVSYFPKPKDLPSKKEWPEIKHQLQNAAFTSTGFYV